MPGIDGALSEWLGDDAVTSFAIGVVRGAELLKAHLAKVERRGGGEGTERISAEKRLEARQRQGWFPQKILR